MRPSSLPIIGSLLQRGLVHLLILRILLDEGECWKTRIQKILYDRYGISEGSGSMTLKLLLQEKKGYIEKVRVEGRGRGQPRKIYRITEKGRRLLQEGVEFLDEALRMLNYPSPRSPSIKLKI
jgi:DNA-binding PadR family transcriptional regulator